MRNLFFLIPIIIFQLISCNNDLSLINQTLPSNPQPDCETCSILFIGSSALSYGRSDVVEIFSDLSMNGDKSVDIHDWIVGGHNFSDHCNNQMTNDLINSRTWDYVILQGGIPYISKEKWHYLTIPYLKELIAKIKIRSKNAYIVYMMPWAFKDGLEWMEGETDTYEQMQENIYYNTTTLVKDLGIATAPVGWAWYDAITSGYKRDLFLSDFTHASKHGAYLTACVFYTTIFLETPPMISYNWEDDDNLQYLNDIASSIVLNNLELWNID